MSKIEEVKKIIIRNIKPTHTVDQIVKVDVPEMCKQICQLYEITKLPLLSDEKMNKFLYDIMPPSQRIIANYTHYKIAKEERDLCEKEIKGE